MNWTPTGPPANVAFNERSGVSSGLRWAFCVSKWRPGQEEWETALSGTQPEEVTRVQTYLFQKDSKASLAGRLMLRRAVCTQLDVPWADIRFERTNRGKPFLTNQIEGADTFSVNVSHHGDYAVLAASSVHQIGVDVMKIEWPKGDAPLDKLFGLMSEQFTQFEWSCIRHHMDEWDQLCMFHRLWSLKESYVKALGVGLNMDLQTIEFRTDSDLSRGKLVTDTKLYVHGKLQEQWRFEETMLDNKHTVATAICVQDDAETKWEERECQKFEVLSARQLMDSVQPLGHSIAPESWKMFQSCGQKPGKK